jgi:DNA helicase HerA-like ATPase
MIAAPTGGGKSYFVGAMAEQLAAGKHPFIIFDTKTDNHVGLVEIPEVKLLKVNPGKIRKNNKFDLKALNEYQYILCIPANRNVNIKDLLDVYREIINYMWMQDGERVFIVEEAHNYNKNSSVPDPLFERIAREGRGYGKLIWFVTQRLQNFNQLLWSQCKYTYLMRFIIASDIRYCAAMVPDFDYNRGKPGINSQLEDHDVLVWDGKAHTIIKAAEVTRKTKHRG